MMPPYIIAFITIFITLLSSLIADAMLIFAFRRRFLFISLMPFSLFHLFRHLLFIDYDYYFRLLLLILLFIIISYFAYFFIIYFLLPPFFLFHFFDADVSLSFAIIIR